MTKYNWNITNKLDSIDLFILYKSSDKEVLYSTIKVPSMTLECIEGWYNPLLKMLKSFDDVIINLNTEEYDYNNESDLAEANEIIYSLIGSDHIKTFDNYYKNIALKDDDGAILNIDSIKLIYHNSLGIANETTIYLNQIN